MEKFDILQLVTKILRSQFINEHERTAVIGRLRNLGRFIRVLARTRIRRQPPAGIPCTVICIQARTFDIAPPPQCTHTVDRTLAFAHAFIIYQPETFIDERQRVAVIGSRVALSETFVAERELWPHARSTSADSVHSHNAQLLLAACGVCRCRRPCSRSCQNANGLLWLVANVSRPSHCHL